MGANIRKLSSVPWTTRLSLPCFFPSLLCFQMIAIKSVILVYWFCVARLVIFPSLVSSSKLTSLTLATNRRPYCLLVIVLSCACMNCTLINKMASLCFLELILFYAFVDISIVIKISCLKDIW